MTKTKTHRAILIDPFNHTISHVENEGNMKAICEALSQDDHECEDFHAIGVGKRDAMYVDAEAGLTGRLPSFSIKGRLIYGKAIIVGHTPLGNPTASKTPISTVEQHTIFKDRLKAMMWKLTDGLNVMANPDVEALDHSPTLVAISEAELIARLRGGAA